MASIEDLGKSNFGYYTPDKQELKLIEGWYPVHVTRATVTTPRTIRKVHKAKIYNIWFSVADASGYNIQHKGESLSTTQFAGKEVSNNGLFFFLFPQDDDDFKENNKGNKEYSEFLKASGISLEKTVVDGIVRYYLPEVHPDAFIGKPMFAFIKKSKPFLSKDGSMIAPMQVQYVRTWSGGEPMKIRQGLRLPI